MAEGERKKFQTIRGLSESTYGVHTKVEFPAYPALLSVILSPFPASSLGVSWREKKREKKKRRALSFAYKGGRRGRFSVPFESLVEEGSFAEKEEKGKGRSVSTQADH